MKTQLLRLTSAARALLLLAALFLALPGLRAQNARPPEKMTYQGFLVDANGVALGSNAPVNHTVEFRIYDASTGGNQKWGESQTVTVDKGYFSVMLGDGSAIGAPVALSSVFQGADASDRFISVKVTSLLGSPGEILPRLRLVTSPYAYMATTLPAGAITNGLFAAASITGDKLATNTLTAANFSTNVGLWTANGANIFRTNGNVGIGTTTVPYALTVAGNYIGLASSSFADFTMSGNNGAGLADIAVVSSAGQFSSSAAVNDMVIRNQSGKLLLQSGGLNAGITIDTANRVGIGTTTPGSQLSVGSAVLAEHVNSVGTSFRVNGGNLGNTVGNDVPLGSFIYYPSGGNQVSLGIHARKASATAGWNGTAVGLTMDVDNQPGVGGGIWLNNGNVGIGTTTPGNKLTVGGGEIGVYGSGLDGSTFQRLVLYADTANGVLFDGPIDSGNNKLPYTFSWRGGGPPAMRIQGNGFVGIGTTSPGVPLDVVGGSSLSLSGYLYGSGGPAGAFSGPAGVSIRANGTIVAVNYVASSDARIKDVIGQSEGSADLKTLLGIKITDYTYKDTLAKGNRPQKKVIAQQVEEVYPQAVTKITDVVPDIFQKATFKDGWVQLATDLKVGDRVKLMGEKAEGIHEVLEVKAGAFRTAFKPATEKVFVYGREVKDFRSVDYEAISMLNVSATQELARKVKAQKTELTELRAELAKLRSEKKSLAATVTEFQAQDEARESRLARLEQALAKDAKVIQAKATGLRSEATARPAGSVAK